MDRRHLLIAPLLPLMPLMPRLEALANTTEREGPMNEPTQRIVETNGIRLNIAEQGKGPLVLLCHGFPESSYSWRHQLGALAAAGFHVVAPDMRGWRRRRSINTRSSTWSATWSASSTRSRLRPRSSSA